MDDREDVDIREDYEEDEKRHKLIVKISKQHRSLLEDVRRKRGMVTLSEVMRFVLTDYARLTRGKMGGID